MPWSPPGDVETPDPALDGFRERSGVLLGDGPHDGAQVLLRAETQWSRVSGHLWWSRWSAPREVVRCSLRRTDGTATDWVVSAEALEAAVADWRSGVFRHEGATYQVSWLEDDGST